MFSWNAWRSICIGIFGTACVAAVAYFLYNNFHVDNSSMPSLDHSKDGASIGGDSAIRGQLECKDHSGDSLYQEGGQHSGDNLPTIDSANSSDTKVVAVPPKNSTLIGGMWFPNRGYYLDPSIISRRKT